MTAPTDPSRPSVPGSDGPQFTPSTSATPPRVSKPPRPAAGLSRARPEAQRGSWPDAPPVPAPNPHGPDPHGPDAPPARTPETEPNTGPNTGLQLAAIGTLISIGRSQRTGPPTGQFRALYVTGAFPKLAERRWPLLVILIIQAALTFRLNWTNTAFMDEALYIWAGHLEWAHWLHGAPIPDFATYFSGSPLIYPPLAALADTAGGLAGARLLSLAFMLGATVLLYFTTRRLYGNVAGLTSAAVFALIGSTAFVGDLATYDAMALFLMAASASLTMRATGRRTGELLLVSAGLLLALANATKYATMLWDPVIFGLAILLGQRGVVSRLLRGVRLAVYTALPIAAAIYLGRHAGYVQGIMSTTLTRPASTTPPYVVLRAAFDWVGMVAVLALFGMGLSLAGRARDRWVVVLLTIAVFLAPAEQARIQTNVSLQKHVDYGAWFAAIAVGYFAARLHDVNPRKWLYGLVPCLLVVGVPGFFQATQLFSVWPRSTAETVAVRKTITEVGCPCLAAEDRVMDYYLYPTLPWDAFSGSYSFGFRPNAKSKNLTGAAAYQAAIKQGYFHVVEVDPDESGTFYTPVEQALRSTPGYVLATSLPNSASPRSPIQIWYNALSVSVGTTPAEKKK
jgi:4-amino-4-deoxy-L-arabinose transferase-like glycosyltransferase